MATFHITETELARDLQAVLDKVRQGIEVIVEQDHRPVAVIKMPPNPGRKIRECMALGKVGTDTEIACRAISVSVPTFLCAEPAPRSLLRRSPATATG